MKSILKLVPVAVITLMLSNSSLFAQATATAAVSANVIAPITLAKNVDMNFGNAAVSASTGGTVVLNPTGTRTAAGSGVTLPAATGTVAAASFTVTWCAPSYTYAITLPSSAVISGPSSATMTVTSFTSTPSSVGTLNATGTQTLTVGASLSVAAGQHSGTYTNATAVPVTVNYN